MKEEKRGFFARYKKHILISIAVYILLTIILIALSVGPQDNPFFYIVF